MATTTGPLRVERRLGEIFERDVAVFLVPTGTAANALALAHVTPPWGVVFCHARGAYRDRRMRRAGIFRRRAEACRPARRRRQDRAGRRCKAALDGYGGHRPHQMVAAALSLTQASEAGTIYRTDEIAALARDRARPRARRAHGWRALRQCPGAAERHAGADDLAGPASTCCRSAPPRAARWRRRRWWCSIRAPRRVYGRTAQARRPSAVKAPLHRRANGGLPRRRLLARAGAPRQCHGRPAGAGPQVASALRRSGRSRPISFSSSCRVRSI